MQPPTPTAPLTAAAFGPYRIVRELAPSRTSERFLAVHEVTERAVVVHRRAIAGGRGAVRRELDAIERAAAVRGAHLLPVEGWGLWGTGFLAWVTPWTGGSAGLVTLRGLAASKGGRLGFTESKRAIEQVWGAVKAAHASGWVHGPVALDEVLVDQQGQVWIENYGLAWTLAEGDAGQGKRMETASVGAAMVGLMTGHAPPVPAWVPGVPSMPGIPEGWKEAPSAAAEAAIAAAVTAALKAEDALPGVIDALKGVTGRVAEAEAAAKSSVAQAAGDMVKSALKHAASTVFDLMRGKKGE